MSHSLLGTRFCFLLGALSLVACSVESKDGDGEVSADELADTAIENVERALRGTLDAAGFIADSEAVANSAGTFLQNESCTNAPCTVDGCPEPTCTSEPITAADLQEARSELDEGIDELVATLRDEVFSHENLESEDDDSVTFLLGPEYFCGGGDVDDSGGIPGDPPEPMLDPACVAEAQQRQPRLRLSSPADDDVDVELLLTAERRHVVTLELHHDHLAVVADLAEIKAALDAAGEDTENLVSLDGKVSLALSRNAERDYSVTANVLEEVVVVGSDDGGQMRFSLGESVPTAELRLDGNARRITGTIDAGRFTASGPLNAFRDFFDGGTEYDDLGNPLPEKTYTGDIELVVAGLEATASYDGATDQLSLGGFGIGDASSTLKWNGITVAQLDLNAAAGRHFDLGIESPATGGPILTLSPSFDLSMLLNFAPLADQLGEVPAYVLNDTLRVFFAGENPRVQVADDQFRVVSGTLELTSSSTPEANVSVAAGMCLVEVDPPVSSHELLGSLQASACVAE